MTLYPGVIKRLDEVVVNRIAAGEVIQRPANALKEMIENSLDAKSTFIQISVKSGGLKYLQIQDNGTGIRKDDMEIVCERFTTSKLQKFEDLSNIATFGFRGEALSSISHVAHLTIQTKTINDQCAYKATYEDGKLKLKPKSCAGNQGTIITVEDLFYNVPQRKQVLRAPNEEFQKISDVVSKYAVHNSNVSFMLKKIGENQASIKTLPNSKTEDNIKCVYGAQIGKELIEIQFEDKALQFKLKGFITNANYSGKKGIFLIFINHRLVESQSLKSSIDSVYSVYLAKGSYPFIYVSLELEPTSVDVNVHPTKHEVHFLNEDDINEKIKQYLETKLLGSNNARNFYKQIRLPGTTEVTTSTAKSIKGESLFSTNGEKLYAKDLIRTDSREQKLDKFLNSSQNISLDFNKTGNNSLLMGSFSISCTKRKETKLTSILSIRKKIEDNCSTKFKTILRDIVFVGVVDKKYGMFQYESKLFLSNTFKLSYELFYQLLIYNFENFKEIILEPPLCVRSLALIALDMHESRWSEEDGPKNELANQITEVLISKAPIMREYFGMKISEKGNIETLPILLNNHKPSMTRLPFYLLRLATDVDWDDENECFKTFCHETANFYSYVTDVESDDKNYKWCVEYVIYPAFKEYLIPNNKFNDYLIELTSLQQLFKVFERC